MANMVKRVGLAIQGGGLPAGAFAAGVIRGLVQEGAFDDQKTFAPGENYDICAFSGTSAGALVAALCWGEVLKSKADPNCRLDGNTLAAALEKQWMYLAWPNHAAWLPVSSPAYAEWLRGLDAQLMALPLWRTFVGAWRTPFFRWLMTRWIEDTIDIADLNEKFASKFAKTSKQQRPGLVLGSADVVRGKIKTFREEDFSLSALLASGSLDDCNGVTTIETAPHEGTYLDGAWGDNPPINELLDYGLDEIWFIQHFPKSIAKPPRAPAERKERKDELWQNSLVEHEMEFVNVINRWQDVLNDGIQRKIDALRQNGTLPGSTIEEVQGYVSTHKDSLDSKVTRLFDENNDFAPRQYKEIKTKTIEMRVERELGSTIVNVPWFIRNLMSHGEAQARDFVARGFGEQAAQPSSRLPGSWAWTPKPLNDYYCGLQSSGAGSTFQGALALSCDLCGGKTMSGVLDLLPTAAPQLDLRPLLPPANKLVCNICPAH